jgi:glutathione S-transferase
MLTLYHCPRTRSVRALWMLEETGCPYSLAIVDLRAGEGQSAEYRKLNPHGKVPTLVHDGAVIPDSTAILLYLADVLPDARLAPPLTDPRRGPYLAWMTYTASVIEPAFTARLKGWSYDAFAVSWGAYEDVVQHLREGVSKACPYLLGEDFSAADILIGGAIAFGTQQGALPQDPELERYAALVTSRSAYKHALAKDSAAATALDTLKEARVAAQRSPR